MGRSLRFSRGEGDGWWVGVCRTLERRTLAPLRSRWAMGGVEVWRALTASATSRASRHCSGRAISPKGEEQGRDTLGAWL